MTRLPDQVDAPMTPRQLATLRTLSAEAYQPKLFEKNLTAKGSGAPNYGAEGRDRVGEFFLSGRLLLETHKRVERICISVATLQAKAPDLQSSESRGSSGAVLFFSKSQNWVMPQFEISILVTRFL